MIKNENRKPNKTIQSNWKLKLRENCKRRVKEDRARLLWKFRCSHPPQHQILHDTELLKASFQEIVAEEFNKIRDISEDENSRALTLTSIEIDDPIWEYEGFHTAYQGECEDILLEMQRIFYEDIKTPPSTKEPGDCMKTWEDEEDEFLAHAVYEHMKLDEKQVQSISHFQELHRLLPSSPGCQKPREHKVVWCPICKQGELQETQMLICCSLCEFKLDKGDEVNLDLLQTRLAEAHAEHLDRGCRLTPKFYIEIGRYGQLLWSQCLLTRIHKQFHMFIGAMLQLFDRSGMLYGELARFVLRMLGVRTKPKQMQPGSKLALGPHNPVGAQNIVKGPKSTAPCAWDNIWSDGHSPS